MKSRRRSLFAMSRSKSLVILSPFEPPDGHPYDARVGCPGLVLRRYVVQRRHGWAVVTLALILGCISAGCSNDSVTGPPASVASAGSDLPILPSDALPGYVVHASGLDAATLAADALDPASLDVVLTGAGFETGIERRFTARWKPVTEVVARALRFASADGADRVPHLAARAWSGRAGLASTSLGSAEPDRRDRVHARAVHVVHERHDPVLRGLDPRPLRAHACWSAVRAPAARRPRRSPRSSMRA